MLLERTIWYLETHRTNPLSLRELAAAMGVTPEYLTRSFTTVTGRPVMAWLRARRLTEAARQLLSTADTVLQIALDAGFSAPEPFSRAFRAEFGLTPSALRAKGHADGLSLTSAPEPQMFSGPSLAPPVVEYLPTFRVAGPLRRYTERSTFSASVVTLVIVLERGLIIDRSRGFSDKRRTVASGESLACCGAPFSQYVDVFPEHRR